MGGRGSPLTTRKTKRGHNVSRTVPQWIKDSKYKFCAVCGRTDDLQYHHWEPAELGGLTVPENIIVLCAKHHQELRGQGGRIKHNYLVKEGIRKSKESGKRHGKRPFDHEKIMRLIAENSTQFNDINDADYEPMTEHEIMEMAGVKPVCYAKCKRMLLDAMNGGEWPYSWQKPAYVFNRPVYDGIVKRLRGDT